MNIDTFKIFPTQATGKITEAMHIRLTTILVLVIVLFVAGTGITGTANAESGATIVSTSTVWLGSDYSVTATYTLAGATDYDVELRIYDTGSNLINTVNGGHKNSGTYEITWDGTKSDGTRAPYGTYTLKIFATDTGAVTGQTIKEWVLFENPRGIAVDNIGNIYVADTGNNAIKKIDTTGTITTITRELNVPRDVAVDRAGNIYVADTGNNAIKKIDTTGTTTTIAEGFINPYSVAVDNLGNIYVADTGNNAIKKIDANGVTTIATGLSNPVGIAVYNTGTIYVAEDAGAIKKIDANGVTTIATGLSNPASIAVDKAGAIYVTEYANAIKKIDANGVTTIDSVVDSPYGIAVDGEGSIYVTELYYSAIKKIDTTGTTTTIAGEFKIPSGVAEDNTGNIYVTDSYKNTVKKIDTTGKTIATYTGFYYPYGIAIDNTGNIYVSEFYGKVIKKIDTTGTTTTLTREINGPLGVAVDRTGNIYVADYGNNAVKKIDTTGTTIATYTGFSSPTGVAVDTSGNIYVVEYNGNDIKKIDTTGTTTTIATGFSSLRDIAIDSVGNIYVADIGDEAIKKIDTTGTTTTIATGFNYPRAVAVGSGTMYVIDKRAIAKYSFIQVSSAPMSLRIYNPIATPTPLPSGVPVLSVVPDTLTTGAVESTAFNLVVDSVPEGLSGYDLRVSLGDPATAKISSVTLPAWATTPPSSYQTISTNEVRICAIDLDDSVKPGAGPVTLATINVIGLKPGTTTISISSFGLDDDAGDSVLPEIGGGSLTVSLVQAFPGLTRLPTDLDGDGLYEDINGNGRLDFNDVVLLYKNMDWIRQNTAVGISPFDFNGSGALDFDDIVVLYNEKTR